MESNSRIDQEIYLYVRARARASYSFGLWLRAGEPFYDLLVRFTGFMLLASS